MKKRLAYIGLALLMILFVICLLPLVSYEEHEMPAEESEPSIVYVVIPVFEAPVPESDSEGSTHRHYDSELSDELQDFVFETCDEYEINPAMVIAIIEKESKCNPDAIGDSGRSKGLMQIQERWHKERMDKLGCTDLLNPEENILIGVDYLAELQASGKSVEWVLMAYNGGNSYANKKAGAGIVSEYAADILKRMNELEGE